MSETGATPPKSVAIASTGATQRIIPSTGTSRAASFPRTISASDRSVANSNARLPRALSWQIAPAVAAGAARPTSPRRIIAVHRWKTLFISACRAIVAAGHEYQTGVITPSSSSTVSDRIAYACHRRDAISHSNAKTGPGPVSFAMQSPPGFTLSGRRKNTWPGAQPSVTPRSQPVNELCQGRNHALFSRPASNLGASQSSTRSVNPGTIIQLMWPYGSRQISGCCDFCQSSSMGCLSANKSWIPSINNIFSFGMTGLDKIRFNRVVSIASCAGLRAWKTRRQKTGGESVMHGGHSQNEASGCTQSIRHPSPTKQTRGDTPHRCTQSIRQPIPQTKNPEAPQMGNL